MSTIILFALEISPTGERPRRLELSVEVDPMQRQHSMRLVEQAFCEIRERVSDLLSASDAPVPKAADPINLAGSGPVPIEPREN